MSESSQEPLNPEVTRVEKSLSRFLLFAIISLLFFTLLNAFLGYYILATIQACITISLPILYIWLKRGAPQNFIKHAIGFATLTVFAPLLFAPSIEGTGIYWIFVFPLVAFFFLGSRGGIQWTSIYIITLLAGLAFIYIQDIPPAYNWIQVSLSLLEVLLCSIISYFFVSDNEKAEASQRAHVHYLKSVDEIERALYKQPETEKGISNAVQTLLHIFAASRVCLIPSPHTNQQQASFSCTVDAYPIQMNNDTINSLWQAAHAKQQSTGRVICLESQPEFAIQSQISIALQPNKQEAWLLTLHQCNYPRHWSHDEQRLFQDIAHRIESALQQLLLYQNLKDSAHKLAIASQQAEAASHAKSEFLSIMSHELRTPLHGIIGLQELIAEDKARLTSEQLEHLTLAQKAAKSLADLVNDILNLSKVESGTIQLNHQSFSLKKLLIDAITPFVIVCRNRNLPLRLHLEQVPEYILGDEIRLRQVLINLIGNAVKFTPQGHIHIHITQSSGLLSFSIKDTGIGISDDMLEHIFEPFRQEAQFTEQQHTGTGLGTTIAKRFVELMGGDIHVESTLKKGSCFTFYIPLEAAEGSRLINWKSDASECLIPPAEQESGRQNRVNSKAIHVLLAEDDPIGQRIAAKRLRRAGMLVDIAEDGLAAWVKAKTGQHDLLLTDIRMPKMNGIELTRRIREDEKTLGKPRLPIVGLSAHALSEIKQECSDAGMDAFMIKPIDPDSVLGKVQEIVHQQSREVSEQVRHGCDIDFTI